MATRPRFALALALLAAALPGCVSVYQRPSPADPHATLKLRRTYEKRRGETLREWVLVDDALAYANQPEVSGMVDAPLSDAVLVRPGPAKLSVTASFFHQERRKGRDGWMETVVRNDGECSQSLTFAPEAGHDYIVDFTYRDDGICTATCFEQVRAEAGASFEVRPCATAPSTEGGAPVAGR